MENQELHTPATSKWSAMLHAKCPRCRRGDVFIGNTYDFKLKRVEGKLTLQTQKMHQVCAHCVQRFEIEPGYFYAAMYVSYAMTVAQALMCAFVVYFFNPALDSATPYIVSVIAVIILLSPFNYRYSRVMLLHWLSPRIQYDPHFDVA